MTIPFDLMTSRAERPAVADRGPAARARGPRDDAFPDALRSAVDAGSRGRDRAAQARDRRDERSVPTGRTDDRADRASRAAGGERTERRADGSRAERAERAERPTDTTRAARPDDTGRGDAAAAQAAVLAALRADGLSADALRSVAALLGEPTSATNDELVQAVLDNVEVATPADEETAAGAVEEAIDAADLEAVVAVLDAEATTGAEVPTEVADSTATAVAADVQATAASATVTDEEAAGDTAARRSGQGHGPSTTGARGLERAAEVAADGARVQHLDAVGEDDAATVPRRADVPAMRAAERALGGQQLPATETTDTARPTVNAASGEPVSLQGLALGRIPTDRGATPGAASVQRVLDALELLEQAPPPRQITLELGDARVRVALDDGQVRLSVLGPGNEAVEKWLEETRAALTQHGFDLGQQAGERRDEQADGDQPPAMATASTPAGTGSAATRDDGGALRL